MHPTHAEFNTIIEHVLGHRLVSRPKQGIEAVSQIQNYRTGSRLQVGPRVYHYGMAGGILNPDLGAQARNPQTVSQEIVGVNAAAGARSIVLTLDNTDGPAQNGLLPANYLEGGTVVVFAALGTFIRGIITNTAVTVNAGTAVFTVELDAPIPHAITVADVAEANASMYRNCVPLADCVLADTLCSSVGVPSVATVANDWLWLQTWGPTWIAPDAAVGAAVNQRLAYFGGDGAVAAFANDGGIQQIAGWVMANDKAGGQGAPFLMLTIDP